MPSMLLFLLLLLLLLLISCHNLLLLRCPASLLSGLVDPWALVGSCIAGETGEKV